MENKMKQNILLLIECAVLYGILNYTHNNALRIGRETAQIKACKRVHAPTIQTFGFVMTPETNKQPAPPTWEN